jgi:hypothetical protein
LRGAGVIEFQNVRDTGFDFVLRPRIRPNIYFGWLIHEDEIWVDGVLRDDREGLRVQHGGQAGVKMLGLELIRTTFKMG